MSDSTRAISTCSRFLSLFLGYRAEAQANAYPEISFVDEPSAIGENGYAWRAGRSHKLLLPEIYTLRRYTYTDTYTSLHFERVFMGQVTIYLDEDTEKKARAAADADGVSLSKWISHRIQKDARAEWPAAVRDLAGAWPDLPSAEQIRRSSGKDTARGRL